MADERPEPKPTTTEELTDANADPRYWAGIEWTKANLAALQAAYPGRWIVVLEDKVVHDAGTQAEARAYVRQERLSWAAVIWYLNVHLSI